MYEVINKFQKFRNVYRKPIHFNMNDRHANADEINQVLKRARDKNKNKNNNRNNNSALFLIVSKAIQVLTFNYRN